MEQAHVVVVELREHLPDVLEALLAAGGHTMSSTAALGDRTSVSEMTGAPA